MKQKNRSLALLILFASILLGCEKTVEDSDGNSYRVVTIGEQTWMAENLKLKTDDSYCYDNKEENCKKYGRLYKHSAAKYACPAKWRLPTDEDWNKLVYGLGGHKKGIEKLKTKKGWKENKNGTDEYGFGMFPGGEMEACKLFMDMRYAEADYWATVDPTFNGFGKRAAFWHADGYVYIFDYFGKAEFSSVDLDEDCHRAEARYVRCIKDE